MSARKIPSGPCRVCGVSDRDDYGNCRPCVRARSRARYAAHPGERAGYRASRKEETQAYNAAYYEAHKEELAPAYAARYQAHRDKLLAKSRTRTLQKRAKRRAASATNRERGDALREEIALERVWNRWFLKPEGLWGFGL